MPTAASGGQAANLDNNSGPEPQDGTVLTSYGVAQKVQQVVQYYPDPPVASTLPPAGACPLCDEG